jgi:hypothetical protein
MEDEFLFLNLSRSNEALIHQIPFEIKKKRKKERQIKITDGRVALISTFSSPFPL